MRRLDPPKFVVAFEASTSTGGMVIPTEMGADVFVMAAYTLISYLEIGAVSLLPAIVYFLCVGFFVRTPRNSTSSLSPASGKTSWHP